MIREILQYPDARLRIKAVDVPLPLTEEVRSITIDMIHTMLWHNGVGLAATQIGIGLRIIVAAPIPESPVVMINPKWEPISENVYQSTEGCLSVRDEIKRIPRQRFVRVEFVNLSGKKEELLCEEFYSAIIQHECDHLDGILIADHPNTLNLRVL